VTLGRGTVTVRFENRGRSAHGELEDVYRFVGAVTGGSGGGSGLHSFLM
jgi:hypothetical protein